MPMLPARVAHRTGHFYNYRYTIQYGVTYKA